MFLTEFTPSYSLTHNGDDAPQSARSFKPSIKTVDSQWVIMPHKDILHLFYLYTFSSMHNFIEHVKDPLKCEGIITIVKLGARTKEEVSVNTLLCKQDNQTVEPTACRGASGFPCKSHIFRKRVKKVIISWEKWRAFAGWWWNVQKCREVKNAEWTVVKCSEVMWSDVKWSEVKWSEVTIWGEMCNHWFIFM